MAFRRASRTLATLVLAAVALLALSPIVSGYSIDGIESALAVAAVAALFNALLWPTVVRWTLPLTVLTLGLSVLVLNGAVLLLVATVVPGVTLDGLWPAVQVAIGVTALVTAGMALLSIDDDERFSVRSRRIRARTRSPIHSDVPGVLFLEIDGLAHSVLQRAMRSGDMPALQQWLGAGTHRLARWETDLSSQTGACQAGILHGNNEDMPAFRWWEKDRGRPIVTNHPRDAAEIERRISDGHGLLHDDGASRANILSGDAPHSLLTMSTVRDVRRGRLGDDYFTYFASPYNMARTLVLAIGDIGAELVHAAAQRRRDVRPRVHRGIKYAVVRAWATAVQLDLQVESVLGDVAAGRPTIYTTFLAYDEVAHHSGIERVDALAVLRRVDRRIARIAAAAQSGPRPYEVVVLSDHGQTQGATFRDRYGTTLDELVRRACGTDEVAESDSGQDEALGRVGAALTEASAGPGARARAVRAVTRGHTSDGQVLLEPPARPEGDPALPEVVVMASGCLGLISFPRLPGRVAREEIDRVYPGLLAALSGHDGIGFVVVRDESGEDLVLGAAGSHRLGDGTIAGRDPLAPFGERAAGHVARTARFTHCPDVLVHSAYWADTDEVAAFEELVGSHGGLGGPQSHPFLLAPAHLPLPAEEIVGAEAVHRVLCGWLGLLGQPAFADAVPRLAPGAV